MRLSQKPSVVVIGGGIIGCAIACELTKKYRVIIVEKNHKIGINNQSSRNSGVIHAGIYYDEEQPLKGRLCVEGNELLYDFCQRHQIPHKKTGKLVVATDALEAEYLPYLLKQAQRNGVPGMALLEEHQIAKLEPHVKAISALFVPTSGIIEPVQVLKILQTFLTKAGAVFHFDNKVNAIQPKNGGFDIAMDREKNIAADWVINAAGLCADEIARLVDRDSPYEIVPVRGEIARFKARVGAQVQRNIYPIPFGHDPKTGAELRVSLAKYQTLLRENKIVKTTGVHLTPTIDDFITISPLKNVGFGKEDDQTSRHPARLFYERVRRFFPALRLEEVELYKAGIMAVLKKGGRDFVIEKDPQHANFINLIGIDSPGVTASLAIARYVKTLL